MSRWTLILLFALLPLQLHARAVRSDVEIYDRHSGRLLPLYRHDGRLYVAGEPGHEYEIRVKNRSDRRVLAVTSVDGVNVISGQTAAPGQSGYVLDRYGSVSIAGWRKSMDRIATFYFTALPDSYAARTGRPDDVGVIGVALFRERGPRHRPWQQQREEDHGDGRMEKGPQAPSSSPGNSAGDAAAESPSQKPGERLGTGHGRGEESWTSYTEFERASERPDEIVTIWYDSRRNLVAQGVIPEYRRYAQRRPQPFPGRFVPDP